MTVVCGVKFPLQIGATTTTLGLHITYRVARKKEAAKFHNFTTSSKADRFSKADTNIHKVVWQSA